MWPQVDVLAEYQLAHRLLGAGAIGLLFFRGITKCKPNPQEPLIGYQDLQGVTIGYADHSTMNY